MSDTALSYSYGTHIANIDGVNDSLEFIAISRDSDSFKDLSTSNTLDSDTSVGSEPLYHAGYHDSKNCSMQVNPLREKNKIVNSTLSLSTVLDNGLKSTKLNLFEEEEKDSTTCVSTFLESNTPSSLLPQTLLLYFYDCATNDR